MRAVFTHEEVVGEIVITQLHLHFADSTDLERGSVTNLDSHGCSVKYRPVRNALEQVLRQNRNRCSGIEQHQNINHFSSELCPHKVRKLIVVSVMSLRSLCCAIVFRIVWG